MNLLIRIPEKSAAWRYDQIAGVELVDEILSVFIVGSQMTEESRRDYEYDDEEEAKEAFVQVLEA